MWFIMREEAPASYAGQWTADDPQKTSHPGRLRFDDTYIRDWERPSVTSGRLPDERLSSRKSTPQAFTTRVRMSPFVPILSRYQSLDVRHSFSDE